MLQARFCVRTPLCPSDGLGSVLRQICGVLWSPAHELKENQFRAIMISIMDTSKDILIALAKERYANEENDNHKRKDFEKDFRPEDFKIYVKTEDELISSLGKREKTRLGNLQRIGKFCNIYQPVTSNYFKTYENGKPHPVSIFPISCLNKHLVRLFGYPKRVSRLLHICQDIGFLVRVSDKYRFNCSCKGKNFCYLYAYNKYVEHLIIDVCRKRKIDIETSEDIFSILDKLKDGTNISP